MPWQERSTMSIRHEFVSLASQEGANMRQLCRRFGISPPTGYKWLHRFVTEGVAGLVDRPRTPHTSPTRTPAAIEVRVLRVRDAHPSWGGRKIRARLQRAGMRTVPSASTITAILRRHDRLDLAESAKHRPHQRFQAAAPNELWQVDFKGHVATTHQGRVHPLSILDDHSRYLIGLFACASEQRALVQQHLTNLFCRYGLPRRLLADNGPPWGTAGNGGWSELEIWLLRLGIEPIHGRAKHPQTQGKVERFHRTLKAEVFTGLPYPDLASCQRACNQWRVHYNTQRPHEALDLAVPAEHYQPSPRTMPASLPEVEYSPTDLVRKVKADGYFAYQGGHYRLGRGWKGLSVAVRPTPNPQVVAIYYGHSLLKELDLIHDRRV